MRLRLTIGDQDVAATLEDDAAARDFASLLPLTLNMHDLLGIPPGTVDRGLDIIAGAGDRFTMAIDPIQ